MDEIKIKSFPGAPLPPFEIRDGSLIGMPPNDAPKHSLRLGNPTAGGEIEFIGSQEDVEALFYMIKSRLQIRWISAAEIGARSAEGSDA